ncbi:MAG: GAF domain-containing protein [Halobacteria archaeon]|nr:GAF domain-containing protein [Halobacteria archaeon]
MESDVEDDSVTPTRILSSFFVTCLGVIFTAVHLLHLIDEDGLIPLLTGVVFPSAFAVFLIYAGYRLFKSNLTDSERLSVVLWTVIGGVGIGSFFIAAVVYSMYEGGSMRHPVFLLINSLNIGTAAGFTVGWYYSKESHQISLLQNKRLELSKQRRINEVVRQVDRAVFRSESRDEIESRVCEILSDADPYLFAWIGEYDPETDKVVPRASSGAEEGYLDEIEISLSDETGEGPTGKAIRTGEVEVMQNILEDPEYEPWREEAEERGYRSSAAVPLVYGDEVFGVLNLYADRAYAFDEDETQMFKQLGNDIAYSIDAVDTRAELEETRRKLEEAQEMAHLGHWDWNPETGEMEWSDEMFRILGLTPGEIDPTYDDFVDFVYPDDTKKVRTAMERSVESHTFDIDYRVIRSDGDIRVVHQKVDVNVYDYGYGDEEDRVSGGDYDGREESHRVFGTVNDVTHERKIDHLLNSIRSISQIVIEAEREEEVFNSSLEILSARSDQGYGFGCASIATLESEDKDTEVDSIYTANRIGETKKESEERWREVYTEEYIDEVLDEGTLTIDDVTQPPYEHHGEDSLSHGAIGVSLRHRNNFYGVMTLHIPSPSRISEEERHLIDEIASNISRGIYALRAEEKIENERDELALLNRIVRHDIRNDMNLVLGWGDILRDHVDDEGEEYLETVLSTSEHVVDLTKTARDFVDAVEKEEEIDLRPVSLTSVVRETVESRKQTYEEAEFEFGEIPKIEVRANDLLSTVFRNLLNNAVQHNDKETPRVEVSAKEKDEEVVVSVADNGPGVPDTQKESIFGRGEKGLESEGTGIGLYLVDTLVDEYGGDVWVEDNEPEGSVFKIKLPKW